jgi:hypothetical protein
MEQLTTTTIVTLALAIFHDLACAVALLGVVYLLRYRATNSTEKKSP